MCIVLFITHQAGVSFFGIFSLLLIAHVLIWYEVGEQILGCVNGNLDTFSNCIHISSSITHALLWIIGRLRCDEAPRLAAGLAC